MSPSSAEAPSKAVLLVVTGIAVFMAGGAYVVSAAAPKREPPPARMLIYPDGGWLSSGPTTYFIAPDGMIHGVTVQPIPPIIPRCPPCPCAKPAGNDSMAP